MIQLTPHMRILVAVQPADFRNGIDGLARVCREALGSNPFSGSVFVFCNKSCKAIKILIYDGNGFWLCQKRLSQGRFPLVAMACLGGNAQHELTSRMPLCAGNAPASLCPGCRSSSSKQLRPVAVRLASAPQRCEDGRT